MFVRGECLVETPFAGKGFQDAVEMVLRCSALGRYKLDLNMPVPEGTVPAPIRGKFFYRFSQGDGYAELALKPGLVPEEFYKATENLHFKKIATEENALRLRRTLEAALLNLNPRDVFNVHGCQPCAALPAELSEAPVLRDDFRLHLADYGEYDVGIEQLRRYHGDGSLCGLCLAWALVRQWVRGEGKGLERKDGLPRRGVKVKIGALGNGVDDAFEFLFRTQDDGRAVVDLAWSNGTPAPKVMPGGGAFAFQIASPGEKPQTFMLREKMVPREYLRLCEIKNENPGAFQEEKNWKALQVDFARRILEDPEPFEK
jgi:hypothetical protein